MLDDGGGTGTGLLEVLGMPGNWLLHAAHALLPGLGWDWTLPLAPLLLRLALLPLWTRALAGRRFDSVSAPIVRAIRARHTGDPEAQARARGDLFARYRLAERVAHAALIVAAVNSVACLLWAVHLGGGTGAGLDGSLLVHSVWTAAHWWEPLVAAGLTAAWYAVWYAEQKWILTELMPARVWREEFQRRNRAVTVAVPVVWALALLPLGALVFLLVWQLAGAALRPLAIRSGDRVCPPERLWNDYVVAQPTTLVPGHILSRPPQTAPLRPHDPLRIGQYELLGRIGRGGMGTVYLAHRDGSATQVALKAVHANLADEPELLDRFEREAEVLKLVDGAYTARLLDAGTDDEGERPYIVMELLDGLSLDDYVAEEGAIDTPEPLRALAFAMAVALATLHERDLVHRDIKPSNVMLTSGGPKLVDFGIVRMLGMSRHTPIHHVVGTPGYMPPEQYDGLVSPATDVWAWGCTIVYAANGRGLFETPDGSRDQRLLDRLHDLDADLAQVVEAALRKEITERPADGGELLGLLSPRGTDHETVSLQVSTGWNVLHGRRRETGTDRGAAGKPRP